MEEVCDLLQVLFDRFLTEFTWISQLDEIKIDFLILGRYNKNIEVLATEK